MGISAASLIGGAIILFVTLAITYVVLGKLFKRTRELGDEHREEGSRKRSLDSSRLRSAEEHVAPAPAPPPTSAAVRPVNPNLGPAAKQLIADMEEQARRSDQERRARMRAHVERPMPPITADGRAAIELGKTARLAIKHVFPPRLPQRSMSYFGGLPIIPGDDFDWPTVHGSKGVLERLNFMAQIDCSELPLGPGRHLLPKEGYLYFFAPMSDTLGPDALHFVARYLPGPVTKRWQPVDMPATAKIDPADPIELMWRGGKRTHFDRFEVEFGWIVEPSEEEVAARSNEGQMFEVAEKIRRERRDAFYGTPAAPDALFVQNAPKDALWTPYEGFPANWRTAQILRTLIERYEREESMDVSAKLKAARDRAGSDAADADREVERLSGLLSKILRFSRRTSDAFGQEGNVTLRPFDAPPDDVKRRIMAFMEDLRVNGMPSSIERPNEHLALPQVLNKWVAFAAVHGAEDGLTDPEGATLIPPNVVAALVSRHASREHWMFGEGVVVQVAADEMKDRYVLLLQLGRDPALNWTVGEMGPLQYWITPEDLAARRFENTVLTIEAY